MVEKKGRDLEFIWFAFFQGPPHVMVFMHHSQVMPAAIFSNNAMLSTITKIRNL